MKIKIPGLSRRNTSDSCTRNKETGELECSSKDMRKDGTAVDVAGFKMSITSACTPVMTEAYENQEGRLEALEKKFIPRTIAKCQKTGRNIPQEI